MLQSIFLWKLSATKL